MRVETPAIAKGHPTSQVPSSTRYVIEVGGIRVDRLVRELYRLGCSAIDQRIPGYLVVHLTPGLRERVAALRGITRLFPAVGTDFDQPITMPVQSPVFQPNEMVRIISGIYQGLSGLIRSVQGERLSIEMLIFGRLMPVEIALHNVERVPVPEPWRD